MSSIHLFRHPFYSHEHHNPNRNTLRDTENEFPNIPRKEKKLPKGCLSLQSRVWMEHFQNWQVDESQDFCSWSSSVKALQRNLWSETSVPCHSPANRPCHLWIRLVITTLFAVVGISRSFVSARSARKENTRNWIAKIVRAHNKININKWPRCRVFITAFCSEVWGRSPRSQRHLEMRRSQIFMEVGIWFECTSPNNK